jgi:4-amino-4-deoxy-L-arabinose transferase-like glycosyltransferase
MRHDPPVRFAGPILLLLLAVALRILGLGKQELWLDEALSWHTATSPDLLALVLPNNTPPLYYLLLRAWIGVFGESRLALRSLSAAEGVAFAAAIMWWARTVFDRRAALWAGLWAAVLPMAVYYSQETRAYAQLTLLLTATYGCITKALVSGRTAWWVAAAAAAAAAMYTHYLAALALVCSAALVAARSSSQSWRRAATVTGAVVLISSPWLLAAWTARASGSDGLEWIAEVWEQTPPSVAVLRSLEVLTLGGDADLLDVKFKQLSRVDFPRSLHLLGLAGLVVLMIAAASRFGDSAGAGRWKWALALLVIGPLALLWSVSWIRPLYVVGRYDQIGLPACPVLLGWACAKLHARRGVAIALGVALLLLLPIGWKLWLYHRAPAPQGEAAAAAKLDARVTDGDVFLFTELRALPVLYELSRRGYACRNQRCRDSRGRRFAYLTYPRDTYDRMSVRLPPRPTTAEAVRIAQARRGERNSLWIVLGSYRKSGGTLAATPSTAALVQRFEELGLTPGSADVDGGMLQLRPAG